MTDKSMLTLPHINPRNNNTDLKFNESEACNNYSYQLSILSHAPPRTCHKSFWVQNKHQQGKQIGSKVFVGKFRLNDRPKSRLLLKAFQEVDSDQRMKEDLKNLDVWFFENFAKVKFFNEHKNAS